jgi:aspartyl/asparaginyl beta-hydroxylase (cupin superfamily)
MTQTARRKCVNVIWRGSLASPTEFDEDSLFPNSVPLPHKWDDIERSQSHVEASYYERQKKRTAKEARTLRVIELIWCIN